MPTFCGSAAALWSQDVKMAPAAEQLHFVIKHKYLLKFILNATSLQRPDKTFISVRFWMCLDLCNTS